MKKIYYIPLIHLSPYVNSGNIKPKVMKFNV